MNDLPDKAKRFAMLTAMKEHHESVIKTLNVELMALGEALYKEFTDASAPIENMRISGFIFSDKQDRIVRPDLKYRPTVVDEELFFKLLRATGEGALIKETVHPKTLESWVTKRRKANAALPAESILKVWTQETAKVSRAPKRAPVAPEGAVRRADE